MATSALLSKLARLSRPLDAKPRRYGRKMRPCACLWPVWRGIRASTRRPKTAGAASA